LCWMTGGSLFELNSTRDLSATFIQIFEEFRNRYLLRYTPRGVSGEGWHQIEVRVKGRRGAARVRSGYMAQSGARSGRLDDSRGRDSAPPSSRSTSATLTRIGSARQPVGAGRVGSTTRHPNVTTLQRLVLLAHQRTEPRRGEQAARAFQEA